MNELKSGLVIFIEILEAKRDADGEKFKSLVMGLTVEQQEEIINLMDLTLPFMKEQLESRKKINEILEHYKNPGE